MRHKEKERERKKKAETEEEFDTCKAWVAQLVYDIICQYQKIFYGRAKLSTLLMKPQD